MKLGVSHWLLKQNWLHELQNYDFSKYEFKQQMPSNKQTLDFKKDINTHEIGNFPLAAEAKLVVSSQL